MNIQSGAVGVLALLSAALVALAAPDARAQPPRPAPHAPAPPPVFAHAVRRTCAIVPDGTLDEPCWQTAPKQRGFTQRFPTDGAKPEHESAFAVMFDDAAIYVAVWMADSEPAQIRAWLTRRDLDTVADTVAIAFDSYHDRRTAYSFQLDAAGVQRDMLLFDDQNQDDTWDAVWTGGAAITADGWTAEFRIPLNQLRFAAGEPAWGFQVVRTVGRTREQTSWSPWPKSAPAIVSKFGTLDGIGELHPHARLELLPYVTGGLDAPALGTGDILNTKTVWRAGTGIDIKYGLGPAFTLSATVNPDFGQVEADPSQVNLSPNQLFFAEKRPFFLEGSDLFRLPIGNSDGSVEGAFYSRRIGAAPDTSYLDYEYLQEPQATTIYGAAKLTGKTPGGWSVGLLDAVTGPERLTYVDDYGQAHSSDLAALTNYAIGRVKRDLDDGKVSLGVSATAVDRALGGTELGDYQDSQAYTLGAQVQSRWLDNAWQANASVVGSYIHGSEAGIAYIQTLNRHLFQRPDATDVSYDPTRTSMDGFGTSFKVGRFGDTEHWRFLVGGDLRSPGLELNDAGYQNTSDRFIPFIWAQYHQDQPTGQFLNWQWNSDVFEVSNFEPTVENVGLESNLTWQLSNYWQMGIYHEIQTAGWDPVALRGGPDLRVNPNTNVNFFITTDPRSWFQLNTNFSGYWDWVSNAMQGEVDLFATIQARSNIDLQLGPSFMERNDPMQYVDQEPDTSGHLHYILASIHQTTTALTVRLDWTFSPHLSLQAYAQPFVGTGRYFDYKDVDNPHASAFADRFHVLSGNQIYASNGIEYVNFNGSYAFDRPDFAFLQLRATVVFRWEYLPGSNIYLIWNHGRTNSLTDGRMLLGHDLDELAAHTPSENVVMLKANYWIGL